jgi:hypothetical protein
MRVHGLSLLFCDYGLAKNAGIREFDGPSNFEVYWSVPPSVKSVAESASLKTCPYRA